MRAYKVWKRILAFSLCLTLLSGETSVLAAEIAETSVVSTESAEIVTSAENIENIENTGDVVNAGDVADTGNAENSNVAESAGAATATGGTEIAGSAEDAENVSDAEGTESTEDAESVENAENIENTENVDDIAPENGEAAEVATVFSRNVSGNNIVNTNETEDIVATIEHCLLDSGEQIYRSQVATVDSGASVSFTTVTEQSSNYVLSKVEVIRGTEAPEPITENFQEKLKNIETNCDVVVRCYYTATTGVYSNEVTFFDYDLQVDGEETTKTATLKKGEWYSFDYQGRTYAGNCYSYNNTYYLKVWDGGDIVLTFEKGKNYTNSWNGDVYTYLGSGKYSYVTYETKQGINAESHYAAGSNENNRLTIGQGQGYSCYLSQNGENWDVNYNYSEQQPIVQGIMSRLSGTNYETVHFGEGVYAPEELFSKNEFSGKRVLEGYYMNFNRVGDTYTLQTVTRGTGEGAEVVVDANRTGATESKLDNFWPLDSNPGEDGLSGGSDDGSAHNWYFATRYDFKFKIEDYIGPLEYSFNGDDDLWVFLDGELVLDMGGLHSGYPYNNMNHDYSNWMSQYPNTVDLWSKIEGGKENCDRTMEHTVTVILMERGGYGSNCEMSFVMPDVVAGEAVITKAPTDDLTFTKVVAGTYDPLAGATFTLYKEDGVTEVDSATSDSNGQVTFSALREGNYVLKETGVPAGYCANGETYRVVVTSDGETADATLYAENGATPLTYIENEPFAPGVDDIDYDKTATLVNWDARTYDINLKASSTAEYVTGGDVIVTTTKPAVDVIMVLDLSSSIDTSKLMDLKSAATGFVSNLQENADENSNIAVVTFNSSATVVQELTALTEESVDSINNRINRMSTSTGTNTTAGLQYAQNILANCTNDKTYVLLFTDGMPRVGWSSNSVADASYDLASEMKANGLTGLYTIRLGNDSGTLTYNGKTASYKQWLIDLSSGDGYALNADDSVDLSNVFEEIREEITTPAEVHTLSLKNVTIQDTIDARFALAEGEQERLIENGAEIVTNDNGTTTITWNNQTIAPATVTEDDGAKTAGWARTIRVQAKEEYIGGNAIATNVAEESYIELDGEQRVLPQPKVNVKIATEISDAENQIFLGETLENYFTEEKEEAMLGSGFDGETYGDSEVSIIWTDAEGTEILAEDIRKAAPEKQTEYTLTAEIVLDNGENSDAALAAAESMKNEDGLQYTAKSYSATASYKVEVVTGTITITKKIAQNAYQENEGDPIFTYKITNILDDSVYYRTVRFDVADADTLVSQTTTEEHLFATDYYVCAAQITGLPQGMYRVEELDTMGYSLETSETNAAQTNCHYEMTGDTAVYAIGFAVEYNNYDTNTLSIKDKNYVSGENDDHLNRDAAGVTFVNVKTRAPQKLTDTDVVKNSLVIGETMDDNANADNMAITE